MTKIEWTHPPGFKGDVWNPVVGCTHHGAGCLNCYADELHTKRHKAFVKHGGVYPKNGKPMPAQYAHPFEKVQLLPERLDAPLRRRMPTCYFVNSVSDLFHKDVPFEFVAAVYGVMAACPQHRFIVLTKRPERMLQFMEQADDGKRVAEAMRELFAKLDGAPAKSGHINARFAKGERTWNLFAGAENLYLGNDRSSWPHWPLANVITGASIANQADADRIIPILLQVPSACRAISLEPMIGPVDLSPGLECHCDENGHCDVCLTGGLDWVIAGGESGPNARPCDIAWIRSIVQQCKAAGVPCFVKQLGSLPVDAGGRHQRLAGCCVVNKAPWSNDGAIADDGGDDHPIYPKIKLDDRKGGDPDEWPEDIRVREFPGVLTGEVTRG